MTHVVTENCIKCKYTDCVDVCPVDCFREGPNFLVIDPDECIDCAVCIPECPANAIYAEEDVPQDQLNFIALNAELARVRQHQPRQSPCPTPTSGTACRTSCNTWKSSPRPRRAARPRRGNPMTEDSKYTRQTVTSVHTWVPGKLFSVRVTRDDAYDFQPGQFARVGLPAADDPDGAPPCGAPTRWCRRPASPGWSSTHRGP